MLRQMKTGMIFLSIGYIAIGLLLLILPNESLQWICYAFGAVILISGAINLIRYFRVSGKGVRAPFLLISGVVAFALGVFLLLRPAFVVSILPVVFGLFILLDGCIRIGNGFELARAKGRRWWTLPLLGLVSAALGVLLILHPFDAVLGVTMLSGLLLVVEGAMNLGSIIYASMELRAVTRAADAVAQALEEVTGTGVSTAPDPDPQPAETIDVPESEIHPVSADPLPGQTSPVLDFDGDDSL